MLNVGHWTRWARRPWQPWDMPGVRMFAPLWNLGLSDGSECTSLANKITGSGYPGNWANGGGAGATHGPLFKASPTGFNGQSMLYYDSSGLQDLEVANFTTLSTQTWYFFVCQNDNNSANGNLIENHSGANRNLIGYNTSTRVQMFSGTTVLTATASLANPSILYVLFNAASSIIEVNGVNQTLSPSATSPGSNGPNGWVLGKDQDGQAGSHFRGYLNPPIAGVGPPSAADKARMYNYLNGIYRIF